MGTPLQYSCLSPRHQPFIGGANNDKKRLGGNDHVCQKGDSPGLFQHSELKSRAKFGPWSGPWSLFHPGFSNFHPDLWVAFLGQSYTTNYCSPKKGAPRNLVRFCDSWGFPLNRLDGEALGESINWKQLWIKSSGGQLEYFCVLVQGKIHRKLLVYFFLKH